MKDLRLILPVFLLILIVLLFTGCKGITPAPPEPGLTDDDTTISGQILMPTICCLPLLEEKSLSKDNGNNAICNETEFWGEVPNAVVELKSAEKGKCNKILDTTITDETGYYEFEDVKPGLYIITAYCPVEGNEDFMVKDVAEKISGQLLDAGIPDCTSTGLALVIEKINNCYNDWSECFNKWSRIYRKVETIAKDVGKIDIPAIMAHNEFGDYCDEDVYELVEMICDWDCCQAPGFTPPGPPPSVASISLNKEVEPSCYFPDETTLNYSFTVTNTGNVPLSNVTLTDDLLNLNINIGTLASGASWNSDNSSDYQYLTSDETGDIINQASVTGNVGATTVSATDSATVGICEGEDRPAISLTKTASPATYSAEDDVITYTFTVTNTGNVTLTDVKIDDILTGSVDLAVSPSTLDPGATGTVTAEYTITQADVDAGQVDNTATATGTPPVGDDVTDTDDETVTLERRIPNAISHVLLLLEDETTVKIEGYTANILDPSNPWRFYGCYFVDSKDGTITLEIEDYIIKAGPNFYDQYGVVLSLGELPDWAETTGGGNALVGDYEIEESDITCP